MVYRRPRPSHRGEDSANPRTEGESQTAPFVVESIPLDLIQQGAQLIRDDQDDDSITELAADLASRGLLQPIGVQRLDGGKFQLLYGARRCLAAQRLKWRTIPAHIHTEPASSIVGTAVAENLLRRALSLKEECDAVHRLHFEDNRSPEQIASLVGKSRSWVLRRLSIPNMPDDLRSLLLDESISIGIAEALALLDDAGMRAYAISQARAANLSVADCRAMVEALRASPNTAEAVEAGLAWSGSSAAQQPILIACAACSTPRPIPDLTIVRVCAGGCAPQEGDTDGNAPGGQNAPTRTDH